MTFKRDNYEVGHGKPPKRTQFEKGHSGNPKGRPRGVRNFSADVEDMLKAQVTVMENGKQKKVSTQRAALLRLREKALKGDLRAMNRLLDLAIHQAAENEAHKDERSLSSTEEDILQRYFDHHYSLDEHPESPDVAAGGNDAN